MKFLDTLFYSTGNHYVVFPNLLFSNDSVQVFHDRSSNLLLTYSQPELELLEIGNVYDYIDKVQYSTSMYEIFALNKDSIYCFLYNYFFLIDRARGVAEKINLNMNFEGIDYLPESMFHTSAVNENHKYAIVGVVPSLSIEDKSYLDKKGFLFIDLKNYQTHLLPVKVTSAFQRGHYYNLTVKPRIKIWKNNLLCLFTIDPSLIIYNIPTNNYREIEIDFAHAAFPISFIPIDKEKAISGYYYYSNTIIERIYLDNDTLYIIYRKGDDEWAKSKRSINGRAYILAFDLNKETVIADQKLDLFTDYYRPLNIDRNKFFFGILETENDLKKEFIVAEYEMDY